MENIIFDDGAGVITANNAKIDKNNGVIIQDCEVNEGDNYSGGNLL